MLSLGYFGVDKLKWFRVEDCMILFLGFLFIFFLGGRKGEDFKNEVGDLSWRFFIVYELGFFNFVVDRVCYFFILL